MIPRAFLASVAVMAALEGVAAAQWVEQSEWPHRVGVGIEPKVAAPLGDLERVAGIGVGMSARVDVAVHRTVRLTGRVGYVFHLIKNEVNTHQMTGLVGVRWIAGPRGEFLWFEGGAVHWRHVEKPMIPKIPASWDLGAGVGVGYDAGRFGARLGVFVPGLEEDEFAASGLIFATMGIRLFGF